MQSANNDRGSALVLIPVCVLILVSLGGLIIDSVGTYYQQRQLNDVASSLANRIATKAIDLNIYYASDGKTISIDTAQASQMTIATQASLGNKYLTDVVITPDIQGAQVHISVTAKAHHIILSSLPGSVNSVSIQASATAELVKHT
jgi:Flp pilus assembly protein TadG